VSANCGNCALTIEEGPRLLATTGTCISPANAPVAVLQYNDIGPLRHGHLSTPVDRLGARAGRSTWSQPNVVCRSPGSDALAII
jgi:hypothetical protein